MTERTNMSVSVSCWHSCFVNMLSGGLDQLSAVMRFFFRVVCVCVTSLMILLKRMQKRCILRVKPSRRLVFSGGSRSLLFVSIKKIW